MIRRVIGIDPSFSGCGLADHDRAIAVAATGETIRQKCGSLYVALAAFVEPFKDEPMLWVVEEPMLSDRNLQHLLNMGHLMSHIHDLAESLENVHIIEVHASKPKIFVCDNGGVNKVAMGVAVFERWGKKFANDRDGNKCDAYALYEFGCAMLRGENPGVRPPKKKKVKVVA